MHFFRPLATVGCALLGFTGLAVADDNIAVRLHKWDTNGACYGEDNPDDHTIKNNECNNFHHDIMSFRLAPAKTTYLTQKNNDWDSPTCQVIFYEDDSCSGVGWSPGHIGATLEQCFDIPDEVGDGVAKSTLVVCEMTNGEKGLFYGNPVYQ